MRDVIIPLEKESWARSSECRNWLLANTRMGMQGYISDGKLAFRFEDEAEADAFEKRWL